MNYDLQTIIAMADISKFEGTQEKLTNEKFPELKITADCELPTAEFTNFNETSSNHKLDNLNFETSDEEDENENEYKNECEKDPQNVQPPQRT